jgi:hypothetical protein
LNGELALASEIKQMTLNMYSYVQKNGWDIPKEALNSEVLSFIFTKRQLSDLRKVCIINGVECPNIKGITLKIRDFHKALKTRIEHDHLTAENVGEMLAKTYSTKSLVRDNESYAAQGFLLNSKEKLSFNPEKGFYGLAVLSVEEDKVVQVTSYHTNKNKAEAISNNI